MSFTGRRPTGLGGKILDGLSALGTVMADGPKLVRINEIDQQILELKQERDHLIAGLIEPGDLRVSKDYDPRWSKPAATSPSFSSGQGRLTQCKGRAYSGRYHDAHPGCPYVDTIHTAHEFTLRD